MTRYTTADCLTALRRAAHHLDPTNATPVRIIDYARHRRPHEPTWQTIVYHLETWNSACHAAGVPLTREGRNITAGYTHAAVITALADFFATHGDQASCLLYTQWAKRQRRAPSLSTVIKHLGAWTTARAAATVERPATAA